MQVATSPTTIYPFLQGGGEMGERTRNFNWSNTPVGTPENWPQSLRTTVSNLLRSRFPMFLWWGEEMIQFYNDAYRPSLGSNGKHPEALGQKGIDCWPEIWDTIYPLIKQVTEGGESTWMEDQLIPIYRNGTLEDVYWTFSYSLVLDDEGRPGGVLVTCMETTEAVKARRRTEETAQSLRNIILQAPVAICIFRGPEFVVEIANDAMFRFWGKSPDEVVGKPLFEGIPEAKSQGYEELMTEVLRSGNAFSASELPVTLPREGTVQTVFINFTYQPLRDDDGTVSGIMAMANDVTEQVRIRHRIEEAKKEAEKQKRVYETITANTPDLMYVFGLDYRFTYANKALLGMWGKTWDTGIGKSLLENGYEPWHAEMHEREIDEVVATKKPVRGIVSFPHAELGKRVYDYLLVPVLNEQGEVEAVAGTTRDITDIQQAAALLEEKVKERTQELEALNNELKRSNAHLEEFAHAASHDLKEPIRKIAFFTNQVKNQLADHVKEQELRSFNRIENAAERMGTLIDDLLLYSHVSQRPHATEVVDLNEKMKQVLEDLELDIEDKAAVIEVGKLPPIRGYRRQLQQLFQNLLTNALKYSKADVAPRVSISARETTENGRPYHLISIADNGIGFEQHYADKIFQMFSRLHGKGEYSGTGVGLSIVKKVVENHDGFIKVSSEPGNGSTFDVYLPVTPAQEPQE